ncbi:SRPBCC domain-containing protein [uncultured Roseobacter sp.]|uniref:SRPBCC domain-containing protein n=1 Tax=uncultured Roseobacter sp. TaxID=114847 RepID=UPI00260DC6C1|nr:SRPBCC domain-containing protein [uncultured Roseobacter sp.]
MISPTKAGSVVSAGRVATVVAPRFTGFSICTATEIAAPADVVWKELTNATAYPEWNPFIRHLSGNLAAGQRLTITVQPAGKAPFVFTPEVLVADENRELRWAGKLGVKGIFDGEHYFVLNETETGTTILRHGEDFSGMLARPLMALMGENICRGFEAMNLALKTRVESVA